MASLRHSRPALVFLAVGVAATLVYCLSGSRSLDALIVLGLMAGAVAALLWGARTRPAARRTLYALAAAELAGLSSWILWQRAILSDGAPSPTDHVADVLWLGNTLGLIAACLFLMRSRERGAAPLLDSGIIACGLGIVAWLLVFEPVAETSSGWDGLFDLCYSVADVAMLALVARLVLRRVAETPAGALLVAGTVTLFAADLFYTSLLPSGGFAAGTWHDAGWLLSPLLIGAAALHPSAATFGESRVRTQERESTLYLLVLAAATLSVPGLIGLELLGTEAAHSRVVFALTSALALLVVVRVAELIRRGDALRRTLSAGNDRLRERTGALELLQKIANAANESSSSDEALARAIREICTATGWPVGHVYVKEPGFPQLAPRPLWHLDDPERWAEFVRLSDALHFVAGHGLPGLVLERGEPVWLEAGGAPDPRDPRSALARELGIRSLFAFPILVGNEVAAVLEFFSTEAVDPKGRLTQLAEPIGIQLARVLERERADAAMRASEARFRSLVDNVPGAIYRISNDDGKRTVHYLSEDILDITGYEARDFVEGRVTAHDVIHPDDRAEMERVMTRASEFHHSFSLEYRMIHRDGGVRWVAESGRAVHDDVTGSTWFDGSLVDVTARKQGEEALAHLAAIVESSQDAIIGTTLDGTIVSWNPGAERLYRYTAAEVVGTSMSATVPSDRMPERDRLLARAGRAEVVENFETVRVRADGTLVDVSLSISPVRDAAGNVVGASVIARDITAAKEAERKLREAEDRFRTLVEQLPMITYIDVPEGGSDTLWRSSYVSPQVETLLGWTTEEWLTEDFFFDTAVHPEDRDWVLEAHEGAYGERGTFTLEYRLVARDGRVRWFVDHMVIARDTNDRALWAQGYLLDITARKAAEERVGQAEQRFRTLAEQLPLTTYIDAPDASTPSYVSPQIETMSGYPAAEWLDGSGLFERLLHPDDRERVLAAIADSVEARTPLSHEYRMIARDGSIVWLRDSAVTVPESEGGQAYRQGYAVDITAAKEAEELLRETEAKYRALVEQLPLATYVEEPGETGATVYISPRIEQLLGYTAEEWVGDPELFWNILHPDDEEWVRAEHDVAYREHTPLLLEYRLIHRDGRTVWIQDEMVTRRDEDGAPLYAQGYFLDITERKAADERLRDAEAHYRTLVEQLPVAVYTHELDDTGSTTYMSARIESMLGYAPDEWLADRELFGKLVHPDDREVVMAQVEHGARTGEPFRAEYRMVARDGRVVWVRDESVTVRADDGTPLYAQGYMLDITERKQSEERLRDSEERTRLLFDTALDAIVTMDAAGTITGWNAQAEATFGWSADEAIGRRLSETVIPPEHRAAHERGLERFLSTGEARVLNKRIEVAALHRDGTEFPVELAITPLARGGTYEFSAFLRDISARRRAEAERDRLLESERAQIERLRELDRLKDEFIALVSHELRTPLTSIRGYLELVTDGASGDLTPDQEQFLGVVARNAERLQSLVGDLLFVAQIEAGRLSLDRADVDLVSVAAESVESGRPLAAPKEIELSLAADAQVRLAGDRGRLGQLFDNFVSNAIKFTPAGGRVDVRIRTEGNSAVIEVADTGMGIPADEQEQLFERFFRSSNATAQAIQGTGLGLTISKAIVDAHGGTISFTSVENQGTTFRIELPLAPALAEAA